MDEALRVRLDGLFDGCPTLRVDVDGVVDLAGRGEGEKKPSSFCWESAWWALRLPTPALEDDVPGLEDEGLPDDDMGAGDEVRRCWVDRPWTGRTTVSSVGRREQARVDLPGGTHRVGPEARRQ